jgi:hypothetical protein
VIDHPFLNFHGLSEDELLEKTSDLHKKLNKAYMWGSSRELIEQLEWMLEMIEEEKAERMKKASFDAMQNMFPATVESDPDFQKERQETQDGSAKVVKPASNKKTTSLPTPMFTKEYTEPKNK